MRFQIVQPDEFKMIYEEMENNFVLEERRDYKEAYEVLNNELYTLYHIIENENKVGFISLWKLKGFVFIEHFVVYEKYRNNGYGKTALELLKEKYDKMVLEAEHPLNEMCIRRLNFYQRMGFNINTQYYYQPSYREGGEGTELHILSYPTKLDNFEYVVYQLYSKVYNIYPTIRKLTLEDDLDQVAKLIYETDPYIYPYLFNDNKEEGIKVLKQTIINDTIYNYKNIDVAVFEGQIVGMVVSKKTPIKISLEELANSFILAGAIIDDKFKKVFQEYYMPMENEPSGVYIANVCIDERYYRCSISKYMLEKIIKEDETYHLEVIIANEVAVHLYKNLGFEVEYEYPGFLDVPCYRMKKTAKRG